MDRIIEIQKLNADNTILEFNPAEEKKAPVVTYEQIVDSIEPQKDKVERNMLIKQMKFAKKNPEHARKVNLTMP